MRWRKIEGRRRRCAGERRCRKISSRERRRRRRGKDRGGGRGEGGNPEDTVEYPGDDESLDVCG